MQIRIFRFYLFTAVKVKNKHFQILKQQLTFGSNKLPIDWLIITQNYKQSDN